MAAKAFSVGEPAHDAERQGLRFLIENLDDSFTVYCNPWLVPRDGGVYELDAVVVAPHAMFVVELKAYRNRVTGSDNGWYVPEPIRSPLELNRKKAQILASELRRRSYAAGKPWVDFLVFLSHTTDVELSGRLSRDHVHTRASVIRALRDPAELRRRTSHSTAPVDSHAAEELHRLLMRADRNRQPVRRIRDYELGSVIDRGDGWVEQVAKHALLEKPYVLRTYWIDPLADEADRKRAADRCRWEAQVLAGVGDHKYVRKADPPFLDAEGVHMCVPFEYFRSAPLPSWLERRRITGKDGVSAIVEIWGKVADAIAYAHRQGVVHRMLRPEVILVGTDGDDPDVRVTGFDLAKQLHSKATLHVSSLGDDRLRWAAPEIVQAFTAATPASDQFGLGALLGYMLAGGRGLFDSTQELMRRNGVITRVRDYNPYVSESLDAAVRTMLSLRPADRFGSVDDAVAEVMASIGKRPAQTQLPLDAEAGHLKPEDLQPGDRVGANYQIKRKLGAGGLATVYAVRHLVSGQPRALKVARPEQGADTALRAEAEVLEHLDHRAIVKVRGDLIHDVPDRLTMVLELVEGVPLSAWIAENQDPDRTQLRKLAEDLLGALAHLETTEVVHKDIKPDNLIIGEAGLTMIDFSLAREEPDNTFVGTALYKDPALVRWTHAADRYAAALCLFELYTGRHAFDGQAPPPEEPPTFDDDELDEPGLGAFFRKALDPLPVRRFPSAVAMRAALLEALGHPATAAPDAAPVPASDAAALPLSKTPLSDKVVATLRRAGVRTQGELATLSDRQLRHIGGLGKKKLRDVMAFRDALVEAGVRTPEAAAPARRPLWPALVGDETDVHGLGLPAPLARDLAQAGYTSAGRLADATRDELLALSGIGPSKIAQVVGALHQLAERGEAPAAIAPSALWGRVCAPLDDRAREVMAGLFGVHTAPMAQAALAERLGISDTLVSQAKQRALDALDQVALDEVMQALEVLLDTEGSVVGVDAAAQSFTERYGELDPSERGYASALVRLAVRRNEARMQLVGGLDDGLLEVVVRPPIDENALRRFLETAREIAGWPLATPAAARASLRQILPEYELDPLALVDRLIADVCLTDAGELFQTPVEAAPAIGYALGKRRPPIAVAELRAAVEQAFGGFASFPEPDQLPEVVAGLSGYRLEGDRIVGVGGSSVRAVRHDEDDLRELLDHPAKHPTEVIAEMLRESSRTRGYRLIVTPPETHHLIGPSVARALDDATFVSFEHRLLERMEPSFDRFERACQFKAQRGKLTREAEAVLQEVLAERGRPGLRTVLGDTAIWELCQATHLVRTLYNEAHTGARGFWALVIPGVIYQRQPLFNEREPVLHVDTSVPLRRPLAAAR